MNYLWAMMILVGIIYGTATGKVDNISEGILESAKEAVTLCLSMAGAVSLWSGLMEIANKSGLIRQMTSGIRPLIHWLFPRIPEGHKAKEYITVNCIANFLGLGWAATPSGLKAMEELTNLEEERRRMGRSSLKRGVASNEMCNFLILNISSLQLVPVSIIAYRSRYGSAAPTEIIGPAILATSVSTLAGIVFCKIMDRRNK